MKIQTMSIVCGTTACNARCPFCVSKMTPSVDLSTVVNWRNFDKACRLAQISGATTVLLTGKGEPTLYPDLIYDYLRHLQSYHFPFIELQTNGIALAQGSRDKEEWLKMGLNTICLSAVSPHRTLNKEIYGKDYPKIDELVKELHDIGYTVRLSIMMLRWHIENPTQWITEVIAFCKANKIKQLTIRPIAKPKDIENEATKWIEENTPTPGQLECLNNFMQNNATPILYLSHGAIVYDVKGQNICLANCLTTNKSEEDMRQIIFYSDGTIAYDWKYTGAVLL